MIFVALGLTAGFAVFVQDTKMFFSFSAKVLWFCFYLFFGGAVGFAVALGVGSFLPVSLGKVEIVDIVGKSTETPREIFLESKGTGYDWVYEYSVLDGEFFLSKQINAYDYVVKYDEILQGDAKLEIHSKKFARDWFFWIGLYTLDNPEYHFFVPLNSVD